MRVALARATAWSAAAHALSFVLPVLLVPYIVSRVSLPEYGAWVALGALTGWLGMVDPGLGGALSRQVALRRAAGDVDGLRRLWGTWTTWDVVLGAVGFAGAAALARPVLAIVAPTLSASILLGLAIQGAASPLLRHLVATLNGLQRADLVGRLTMGVGPLSAAGAVGVLEAGLGLEGLAWNGAFFVAIQIGLLLILIWRQGLEIGPAPGRFSREELAGLVRFGWLLQTNVWVHQAFRSDRLLLGATGHAPATVSLYQFGAGLVDRLAGSVTVLSTGVLPAAADLEARGEVARMKELLIRGTRYHVLAALGLLGFAALFAPELLVLWLGSPHPESAQVLRILAFGGFFLAATSCARSVAAARGRAGRAAVGSLAGFGAAVLLYTGGLRRYDVPGLAVAVSLGWTAGEILFMSGLRGIVEFHWREMVGKALLKPLVAAAPLAALGAVWLLLRPSFPVETRLTALAFLAPTFLVSFGLGAIAARSSGALDASDLALLRTLGRLEPR